MGRRRKPPAGARALDGWVIVDKPSGISSAAVVGRLRATWRPRRIGHGGTLDPLATGVLPVAMGEATKTVTFAMDGLKSYDFTLRFGERRDCDDAEGAVVATSDARPSTDAIAAALPAFIGKIEQTPPAFSAIKVAGRRAYALARAGAAPDLSPRRVRVTDLRLVARPDADTACLALDCGKGVYVRSLARDLAAALGTVGYVAALRRTRVGPFSVDAAIPLDKLCAIGHSARAFEHLVPVRTVLDDIPALALTGDEAAAMRHGRPVRVSCTGGASPREIGGTAADGTIASGALVCAMEGERPVALARLVAGEVRPVRVLNL